MQKHTKKLMLIWLAAFLFLVGNQLIATPEKYANLKKYEQYDLNIPGVTRQMLTPEFWINKIPDAKDLIMTADEIDRFNNKNFRNCEVLKDLRHFRQAFTGEEIREMIAKVSTRPKAKRYLNGKLVGDEYFTKLEQKLNIDAVLPMQATRYAITVTRTEMRAFPTHDRLFSNADDFETDRFIETAVYPLEPLAILHESSDGKWYLAQSYNYLAWIPAKDIALTSRNKLFNYLEAQHFLVVTGKGVLTANNPIRPEVSEMQLDMGVRLPLASRDEIPMDIDGQHPAGNYVVKLPVRNAEGKLEFGLGLVARVDDVRVGYLPYTKENVIRQAFKFLGQRYGWGGMFNTRDCSAFIMDNYRSMGIMLPRNASEQGKLSLGISHKMSKETTLDQRQAILDKISVSPVYMNGHAMLYLTTHEQDYFIIHNFAGIRAPDENGKMQSAKTRCVFITPLLSTYLSGGRKYLEGLYAAREFRFRSLQQEEKE